MFKTYSKTRSLLRTNLTVTDVTAIWVPIIEIHSGLGEGILFQIIMHRYNARTMRTGIPFVMCALSLAFASGMVGQTGSPDQAKGVLHVKLDDASEKSGSAKDFWTIALGPLVMLLVGGFGAVYLRHLENRHRQEQMRMEEQSRERQTRDQLLLEKVLDQRQWANQKLMERRFNVFDLMAPRLNDLYCLLAKRGAWTRIKPPDAVVSKRALDRKFYVNLALFPKTLQRAYFDFMHSCFLTFAGPATGAKLRAVLDAERISREANWDSNWEAIFTNESDPEMQAQPPPQRATRSRVVT